MTLNILFMSITVKKRLRSRIEYDHDRFVNDHFEKNKMKQETIRLY
ncbi:YrzI family small protein [Bacillus sp. SCS-153A]